MGIASTPVCLVYIFTAWFIIDELSPEKLSSAVWIISRDYWGSFVCWCSLKEDIPCACLFEKQQKVFLLQTASICTAPVLWCSCAIFTFMELKRALQTRKKHCIKVGLALKGIILHKHVIVLHTGLRLGIATCKRMLACCCCCYYYHTWQLDGHKHPYQTSISVSKGRSLFAAPWFWPLFDKVAFY